MGAGVGTGRRKASTIPSVGPSICTQGRVPREPPWASPQPAPPAVRMSDGPPPSAGPRPRAGSCSLAVDTVCLCGPGTPTRHTPFLSALPPPEGPSLWESRVLPWGTQGQAGSGHVATSGSGKQGWGQVEGVPDAHSVSTHVSLWPCQPSLPEGAVSHSPHAEGTPPPQTTQSSACHPRPSADGACTPASFSSSPGRVATAGRHQGPAGRWRAVLHLKMCL